MLQTIALNGAEPFELILNILSTEGPMRNLVKIAQVVSEKKIPKNYTIYNCTGQSC